MTSLSIPDTLTTDERWWLRLTKTLAPLKVVYAGVPKSACTSLTWLIAELAGEDLDSFQAGLDPLVTNDLAIHTRHFFQQAKSLGDVDADLRRTISPDNGWFVFAAVRDPYSRIFSAWQNKFLLHDPVYRQWRDADWYPQAPERADDVVRDFARFVDLLHAEPDHPVARDPHFSDQVRFLLPDLIPYSRIYDVTEMAALLTDLGAHMRAHGVERELTLRRANETVLRVNARALPMEVRAQIEEIHAADFDAFGHLWDVDRAARDSEWTSESIHEVGARIMLHERIGDLVAAGRAERERVERAVQRLDSVQHDLEDARQRAQTARRRLGHAQQRAERASARVRNLEAMRSTQVGLAARRLRSRLRRLARPRDAGE